MKIIIYSFYMLLIITNANVSAQEELRTESNNFKHSFGVHAGAITGLGFSYRYFPEKWGFQVTGVPVFSSDNFFSSAGLSFMYKITSHHKVDLFTYLGAHHIHERDNHNYTPFPPLENPNVFTNKILNTGFGAGINIHIWEVLDLSFQAGYGVYNIINSPASNITGEIGFYYRF